MFDRDAGAVGEEHAAAYRIEAFQRAVDLEKAAAGLMGIRHEVGDVQHLLRMIDGCAAGGR